MNTYNSQQSIERGDKIYARLSMHGRTLAEFSSDRMNGISDVITNLRHVAAKIRGLATLYVRNQSRGWSTERPLMLYNRVMRPNTFMGSTLNSYHYELTSEALPPAKRPQPMAFPWSV